jgi:hypothetical protein
MFKSTLKLFRSDYRIIANDPMILFVISGLFLAIIVLRFLFNVSASIVFSRTGFQLESYYSLIAITLVCFVPFIIGILYANVILDDRGYQSSDLPAESTSRNNFLLIRMSFAAFVCFIIVLLTILLVKPVPTEGWLRNLFAAFLLSIQSPFVCLLICTLVKKNVKRISVFILCSIFLITVPFGLLIHHPWNYFVFFSPLYWVSWAWIVRPPVESLMYGTISVIIISIALIVFLRSLLRKNTV